MFKKEKKKPEAFRNFLEMVCAFRESGHAFNIPDLTVEDLIQNEGKWHKNCRRELRRDRLHRLIKKGTTSTIYTVGDINN